MSALDKLFSRFKERRSIRHYFEMLDGYVPAFSSFDGGVYEMELTRACIHTFATHCGKLMPSVSGADLRGIKEILNSKPNEFMTGIQFLYKAATIYEAKNTVFILPILDQFDTTVGFYPANPATTELVTYNGQPEPYLRFTFPNGEVASFELSRVGVVSKFLYHSDLVGEDNRVMDPTLQLMHMQNQGIAEGIKNSASFRFMANVSNFTRGKDLKAERENFVRENFGPDSGGLALFPSTYSNVRQVTSNPRVVDPEQMKIIQERAFIYFGTNLNILQNKATGDEWSAYYEGRVEPFAIGLSQAMTCMTYTALERARSNKIVWSSNRLQYMTNTDKLQVSSQMFDRGVFSQNDIMDIWNLPHVPDGDKRYIRKEYIEVSLLDAASSPPVPPEPEKTPKKEEPQNANPTAEVQV